MEQEYSDFISKYRQDLTAKSYCQDLEELIGRMDHRLFFTQSSQLVTEVIACLLDLSNNLVIDHNLCITSLNFLLKIFYKRNVFPLKLKYINNFIMELLACTSENSSFKEEDLEMKLQLLQILTYGISINELDKSLKQFINFLINLVIKTSNEKLLKFSLMNLQNLINSTMVQKFISQECELKEFYPLLLRMYDNHDHLIRILVTSILSMLNCHRENIFKSDNEYIIAIIFNAIPYGNDDCIVYAVDLIVNLFHNKTFVKLFSKPKYLKTRIQNIVDRISKLDNLEAVSKLYDLLSTFCSTNICNTVYSVIFDQQNVHSDRPCPLTLAAKWFCAELREISLNMSCSGLFLKLLLKEVTNYAQLTDFNFGGEIGVLINQFESQLKVCILQNYKANRITCQKITLILDVLTSLCDHDIYLKIIVTSTLDIGSILNNLVEVHLQQIKKKNILCLPMEDSIREIVDVIIRSLMFMFNLKSKVEVLEDYFYFYLQDPRMMKVFAMALMSDSKSRIQNTFNLIHIGMKLNDFPKSTLYDLMHSLNIYKNEETSNNRIPEKEAFDSELVNVNRNCEESVNSLIAQFKKNLELQNVKPSQIMDIYEYKIQSLQLKCKEFEQLLDAKAKTLQQAENIICNYRMKWAQDEGFENLRLRNLLHETEKRVEAVVGESTKLKAELAGCMSKLQSSIEDVKEATNQRDVLSKRTELSEMILREKNEEIETKNEFINSINCQNEHYKTKINELMKTLDQHEVEQKKLKDDKKQLIVTYNELKSAFHKVEAKLTHADEEKTKLLSESLKMKSQISLLEASLEEGKAAQTKLQSEYDEVKLKYHKLESLLTNVTSMITSEK